jgi:hypothetical protein
MNERAPNIVADGPQRLRATQDRRATLRRIADEIRARHQAASTGASWWRRVWIELKIWGEAAAELRRQFPPGNLHLLRGSRDVAR